MNPGKVQASRIRALNDRFRTSFIGGRVLITEGVRAFGQAFGERRDKRMDATHIGDVGRGTVVEPETPRSPEPTRREPLSQPFRQVVVVDEKIVAHRLQWCAHALKSAAGETGNLVRSP
ncbi:MAG: hypothetical protein J0M19_07205, partial [Sphingomonadales bacterium]|nr:hypothetical protein [Sphingomonadales bacterium]